MIIQYKINKYVKKININLNQEREYNAEKYFVLENRK